MYPGECDHCDEPIEVGQLIETAGVLGWIHATCPEPTPGEPPKACPTCWLVGPCDCETR